jgi:hypothetical protein
LGVEVGGCLMVVVLITPGWLLLLFTVLLLLLLLVSAPAPPPPRPSQTQTQTQTQPHLGVLLPVLGLGLPLDRPHVPGVRLSVGPKGADLLVARQRRLEEVAVEPAARRGVLQAQALLLLDRHARLAGLVLAGRSGLVGCLVGDCPLRLALQICCDLIRSRGPTQTTPPRPRLPDHASQTAVKARSNDRQRAPLTPGPCTIQ